MSDKERLIEIKKARKTILDEESFQKKCIFLYSFEELGYLDWLIEQAEKVEQLQRENEKEQKRLQKQVYETVEENFLLEKQLQQAKAKAERYKQALEFYADENNYVVDISEVELPEDIPYAKPPIVYERGIKARKALEDKK